MAINAALPIFKFIKHKFNYDKSKFKPYKSTFYDNLSVIMSNVIFSIGEHEKCKVK